MLVCGFEDCVCAVLVFAGDEDFLSRSVSLCSVY